MSAGFLLALKVLDLLALVAEDRIKAQPAINSLQAQMKAFAEAGRGPTPEEWADVERETDALIDSIMVDPPASSIEG